MRPVEHRSQKPVSRELSRLSGTEERGFSPFDVHTFDEDRTRFGLKLQLLLGLPSTVHELYSMYVEPDRIGTGLGRLLMEDALEYLRRDLGRGPCCGASRC